MTAWRLIGTVGALAISGAALAEDRLEFSLPIACEPHKTCFIQSYVDVDAGPGVSDFACGGATYDAHDGVDFRLLSAAAAKGGIAALAAADGVVKGVRDGVADIFVSKGLPGAVKGRECGNGLVIDHGEGWETQYCHLKQGSVTVKVGQSVKRGDRLGDVGYSGLADSRTCICLFAATAKSSIRSCRTPRPANASATRAAPACGGRTSLRHFPTRTAR